jgi:photosystem II stability/assembly factor-like uncharacterized protein
MRYQALLHLFGLFATATVQAQTPARKPGLTDQVSGTTALLQAVSAVNERVVWVSGHKATFAVTTDGGQTWRAAQVPGDTTLQFRDVHAADAATAYLMSAGTGKASRIYRTNDAGKTWVLQHTNPDSAGFYDCMDFWDRDHGLVSGDEVDGKAVVLSTADGGRSWNRVPDSALPVPRKNEGSFAASGSCLVTRSPGYAWIATGAGLIARVFRTADRGRSWSAAETPVTHANATSGHTSVSFRDTLNGIAVGGDVGNANEHSDNVAVTRDGGKTWAAGGRSRISGAFYGAAYIPGTAASVVGVGPKGADYSTNNGASWEPLDERAYWSVGFAPNGTGWMVGPGGRITRINSR